MSESRTELLICPNCGYDLRVASEERCPECGEGIERARALGWQIPWVHRRSLGWWRAYWRTAGRVTFRGRAFLASLPARVEYADAQRFRWVTLGFLYAASAAIAVAYAVTWEFVSPGFLASLAGDAWFYCVCTGSVALAAAAATGMPSYAFHPRKLGIAEQNRAIALSYYMCAPLAWVWVAIVPFGLGAWLEDLRFGRAPELPPWSLLVVLAVLTLMWLVRLVQLARRVPLTRRRVVAVAIVVPLNWIGVFVLIGGGLPVLVFYIVLLVRALR